MSALNSLYGLSALGANEQKKLAVWAMGRLIPNYDAAVWRWDAHGNVLKFDQYGDRSSDYGWEFDHYPTPVSLGGTDDLSNLRPLHWRANAGLGGALGGLLNSPSGFGGLGGLGGGR